MGGGREHTKGRGEVKKGRGAGEEGSDEGVRGMKREVREEGVPEYLCAADVALPSVVIIASREVDIEGLDDVLTGNGVDEVVIEEVAVEVEEITMEDVEDAATEEAEEVDTEEGGDELSAYVVLIFVASVWIKLSAFVNL